MNYGAIIHRAWEITWSYRFLWWLGMLALFTESTGGLGGNYHSSGPSSSQRQNQEHTRILDPARAPAALAAELHTLLPRVDSPGPPARS